MAETPIWCRKRIVIHTLGLTTKSVVVTGAPKSGIIRRLRATIAAAQDAEASVGTGPSTDMAIAIGEGSSAAGLGGTAQQAVVTTFPLGTPRTTLDTAPDTYYQVQDGQALRIFAATNANGAGGVPDAEMVVTLDIELVNIGL